MTRPATNAATTFECDVVLTHYLCSFLFLLRPTTYAVDMSANSSSDDFLIYHCLVSKVSVFITTGTFVTRAIVLLPLFTFILYLGHQQWRQQRSFKTASHSDLFTYHLAVMELIWVFGCFLFFDGIYANHSVIFTVGVCFSLIGYYGEMFFHVLTCLERYLAVVHPVTYMGLRNERGVRVRNISIGCVWLLSFVMMNIDHSVAFISVATLTFCLLAFIIIVVSFCSVSVLCVLIRPGPGEGGGGKERVDQSKRRAFLTITAILCVLWLWFIVLIVATALDQSPLVSDTVECIAMACLSWFYLPSSLVSPILYLYKAGKLSCCRGQ